MSLRSVFLTFHLYRYILMKPRWKWNHFKALRTFFFDEEINNTSGQRQIFTSNLFLKVLWRMNVKQVFWTFVYVAYVRRRCLGNCFDESTNLSIMLWEIPENTSFVNRRICICCEISKWYCFAESTALKNIVNFWRILLGNFNRHEEYFINLCPNNFLFSDLLY